MSEGFKFGVHESLRNPCYAGLWTLWNYVYNAIHSFLKFFREPYPRSICFLSLWFSSISFYVLFFGRYFLSSIWWLCINFEIISPSTWRTSDHFSFSHRLFFPQHFKFFYGCLLNISKFFVNLKGKELRIRNSIWMKIQLGVWVCWPWCQRVRGRRGKAAEIDPGMWFH